MSIVGQDPDRTVSPRVALITHAHTEIGVATVQALARAGVDLALATEAEPDPHFLESLRSYGGQVVWFPMARTSTRNQASQLARAVATAFGRLDVLVANTVHRVEGQIDDDDVDDDALGEQLDVDMRSVIALIKAASKVINDGGRVVALGSSLAARTGTPGLADFAATRAAITAFCKGAAHDLGPRGITVNVVQIGAIASRSVANISKEAEAAEREANALKRLGTPSEVAEAILFLVGPGAAFITGSVLNVDGGYSA